MIPDSQSLEILKEIKNLIEKITSHDLDTDKLWLSNVFQALGMIITAHDILEEDINKGKSLRNNEDWGTKR